MENKLLEKIYKSSLKFLTPVNLKDTYEIIVKEVMKLLDADYGSVFLQEKGELKRVYASHLLLYKIKIRKTGFTYKVFKSQKPIVLTGKEVFRIHPEFKQTKARSDILVPLSNQGRPLGVLTVMSFRPNFFTEKEMHILNYFGPLASLAILKAQLYNELKQALETRDLFIAMAAHELRTPLTAVSGYVQLLSSKLSGTDKIESKWIEQLTWETHRLTELVKELLEVNRIKSGRLQYIFKENSLREIIKKALNDLRFTHSDREVIFNDQLNGDRDLFIGDYDKMLQVLNNVIDNAIKFSPSTTPISIFLGGNDKQLILRVRDFGMGISRKELPNILEGYYRGRNHSREGMGIGLYIVNDIIRRHRGMLKIQSKIGKGTKVEIKLPTLSYARI